MYVHIYNGTYALHIDQARKKFHRRQFLLRNSPYSEIKPLKLVNFQVIFGIWKRRRGCFELVACYYRTFKQGTYPT